MKVKLFFDPYAFFVGFFWYRSHRKLIVAVLPTLGFICQFRRKD